MAGVLVFLSFVVFGIVTSRAVFRGERGVVSLWLGGAIGIAASMWLPALFSFALGFTKAAQLASAAFAIAVSVFVAFYTKQRIAKPRFTKSGLCMFLCVAPLFLLGLYLLYTHVLLPFPDGSLHAGQSTYGDMSMHLGFITSISEQTTFPPNYSILPNTPVGYPFLCDSVSSTLYTMGMSLRAAYIIPMAFALLVVLAGGYILFRSWLKDDRKAALAYILFFIGGGFGFFYFFDGDFSRIFTAFYQTPTNYVEHNIEWVNPIADLLIPQRATLFGWTLLFPCIYLLYRAATEGRKEYFAPLGVLAGLLPLVHTHSFLALGLLSAVALFFALKDGQKLKPWLIYAGIALVVAAPQLLLFTFRQSGGEGFLRFGLNWANEGDNYFWFYIKNIGLPYLLIVPAFIHAKRDIRRSYAGGLLILIISEFIIFQPNPYDNNKLLYVWHLLTCGLVANLLVDLWDAHKGRRIVRTVSAVVCVFLCTFSGLLTLGREAVSDYELFSKSEVEASEFVIKNTAPDSLFLTRDNHDNAVAALTGRNILCGSGSFLHFHGLDYADDYDLMYELFENPSVEKLTDAGIDYVLISSHERFGFDVDENWFEHNLRVVYDENGIVIYSV